MSKAYFYVNAAWYQDRSVVKIGVTNNVHKRTREFNNGVRHRSKIFKDLVGVMFSNCFVKEFDNRENALLVEKMTLGLFKDKLLREFGREVVDVNPKCILSKLSHIGETNKNRGKRWTSE